MQRYDSYKDSGIYFLPNIPQSWQVLKAKYLFKQEKRAVRPTDEIVTCFRDGQVTLRRNRRTEGYTNSLKEIGYQGVRKGDLVIHNMDAFAGAIGVSDSDGKGTPVYSCCTAIHNDINQYYYCYLLRYLARNGFILSLAKGIRERSTDFRFADFKELYLPVPSIREQDAIVSYINTQCAKIDEAIAQQQKMIDLLNERKQIIINNAVTKGLNPNAKMKPSGIDWIGNIPEHWEVKKLKHVTSKIGSGSTPRGGAEVYQDSGVMFLRSQNIYNDGLRLDDVAHIVDGVHQKMKGTQVKCGDILYNITGGSIGRCCCYDIENEANVNQHVSIVRPQGIIAKYLMYNLQSDNTQRQLRETLKGGNREGLAAASFKEFLIPTCPKEEQIQIVSQIEKMFVNIDQAIANASKQIALLQERKQIIINDVVTGKVKVI